MNIACCVGPLGLFLLACGGRTVGNTDEDTGHPDGGYADNELGAEASPGTSVSLDAGSTFAAEAGSGVATPGDAACKSAGDAPTQPAPVPLPVGSPCATTTEPVAAWSLGGSATSQYQTSSDSTVTCNGAPSLLLASSTASVNDFGEMGNARTPGSSWLGHRLRLSGWVSSSAVTGWAGLWMRVDSATDTGLAFDNMQCRAISGTSGWAEYEVVLDVPADADLVAYGILLDGPGQVWVDGVSLDVVDDCVATTGCP